ncbi:MAG: hypothetical protein Q8Q90_03420 [bacterium]|nr:hypothetical protein [bacterium]
MDAVICKIRQTAMQLAVAGSCKVSLPKETETGEFDIDFSTRSFFGKANIRISRLNGGYVSVIALRVIGRESECFWDYRFFDVYGNYLKNRTWFFK